MEQDEGVGQPDLSAKDDSGREEDVPVPGTALRELAALLGDRTYLTSAVSGGGACP